MGGAAGYRVSIFYLGKNLMRWKLVTEVCDSLKPNWLYNMSCTFSQEVQTSSQRLGLSARKDQSSCALRKFVDFNVVENLNDRGNTCK